MRIAKIMAAAAVLSLAGAPALAEAGAAAARTTQVDRASANTRHVNKANGGRYIIYGLALAAIIGAIIIAADNGNNNPTSA